MGPVVSGEQLERVAGFVDRAVDARRRGRRPVASGSAAPGFFYEPSVVVGPAQDAEIVQREVFGPVVTVQRFADEDQALRLGERRRLRPGGERVDDATSGGRCGWRRALQFGTVWVNDHIPIVSELPHGGFKQSGYGKDMSIYAIEHYTELKHVMVKW